MVSQSDDSLRATFDSLIEGCQVLGEDYRYLYINHAAERHNRRPREELLGQRYIDMWPGVEQTEVFRLIKDCMTTRRAHNLENEFVFPDGGRGWFELRIEPVPDGVFILSVNITERKRAEIDRETLSAQLVQAQKMEAVGRLSGGIAHDFNNMLAVILSHAELLMQRLGPEHALYAEAEQIREAGQRSADLTRQLLTFARGQAVVPRVLDLSATVAARLPMLRRLIGEHIELAWTPGDQLWNVLADPSQVEMLFVNLCVNARDAITGSGKIGIATDNVQLDASSALLRGEHQPGDYVRLSVRDDGRGMDRATQERLFEPFFSTKGIGTGLGLATVYGIVKQSQGFIHVESEPGRGTTLQIYLPRDHAAPEPPSIKPTEKLASAAAPSIRGSELVLLVEDESMVLRVCKRMLEQLGYRLLTAASPQEALKLASESPEPIDLLLTDVIMPGMNGRELSKTLTAKFPHMRVLFASGYTENIIGPHGVLEHGVHFIQKPYTQHQLATMVRAALT